MISTGASSRAGLALSRVTLVGEHRRVDLVLPSQEPIGRLLPEVMRLLGDRVGVRPQTRHLVAGDGSVLDLDATLESADVADGAVLRLVRVEDAPSAPVVHDVTDEAADDLDVRAWRWRPAARRVVAGGATVGWALVASFLARQEFAAQSVGAVLVVVAVLAAAAGAVLGRAGLRGLAGTLVVTGGALGVFGVWSLADAQGWCGWRSGNTRRLDVERVPRRSHGHTQRWARSEGRRHHICRTPERRHAGDPTWRQDRP